jgi:hypothetical protein
VGWGGWRVTSPSRGRWPGSCLLIGGIQRVGVGLGDKLFYVVDRNKHVFGVLGVESRPAVTYVPRVHVGVHVRARVVKPLMEGPVEDVTPIRGEAVRVGN